MSSSSDAHERAKRLLTQSPRAMPLADALKHIRRRREKLLGTSGLPPDSIVAPEPMPVLDRPDAFAQTFWETRPAPRAKGEKKKPTAKSSTSKRGRPTKRNSPFTVIDGDRKD
jgi:hypothetical protein